jgi:acyl-coenzyme A thioesterase PaaI-like protein
MRKISNPYIKVKEYCCFGCSPDNKTGLRLEFYEDGDEIYTEWQPTQYLQGYVNVVHGGIQSTLMDEIAAWVVLIKLKTSGVTSRIDVKLKKPVYSNKGKVYLRARLVEVKLRIAQIAVNLFDADNNVCASGDVYYYIYPVDEAIKNLCYPEDYSSFFED